MLSAVVMVVLTRVTMVTTEPLLHFMRTPDNIMEGASSYLMMIYGGLGQRSIIMWLSCILRGVGDSRTPLYFLIVSSLLNVVLDLLFVITFHMGWLAPDWLR